MAIKKRESEKSVQVEPSRALSPFEDMERWFEDMLGRPFPFLDLRSWPRFHRWNEVDQVRASADLFDDGENVVLRVELPGIKKDEIEVTVTADLVTISGEKKKEEKVKKKDYYRLECSSGSFTQSFRLPTGVMTDKAKAKFEDGVLSVRIPKTEQAKKKVKQVKVE
jgi:HSP20 family protein